jgi:hypothetical protein
MSGAYDGGCDPGAVHVATIATAPTAVVRLTDTGRGDPTAGEGQLVAHRLVRLGLTALAVGAFVSPAWAAAAPVDSATATSGPRIRATGQRSLNWSGYAVPGVFTEVGGSWVVPRVAPSATTTYSSTWIGVDGLANRSLIQTGTESDVINGVVHYDAWWEILPAAEQVIPKITVGPGDHMTASVVHLKGRKWTISLTDVTSGAAFTLTHGYWGTGMSAEWIEERPQVGRSLATLSDYGSTTFTGLTDNGASPGLVPADAISMVGSVGGPAISTPSAPSPLHDAFTVAYGAVAPPVPPG